MRRTLSTILLLALCLLIGAPAHPDYLFTNGTLVRFTDARPLKADLRVIDQRIADIGPGLTARDTDTVVDLRGGYLMPGLAEMHAHVPAPDRGQRYRDDVLFLWIANGVTTVRGMLGHPDHLALRQALAEHRVLGPRLLTAGPSFNGNSVSSPLQAREMVRAQAAAGYDFLKIHPGLERAEYDAIADEARRLAISFSGHVPAEVGLQHALDRSQAAIDHLDGFLQALAPGASGEVGALFGLALADAVELERLPGLARQLRDAGVWVVPTETLIENFAAAGDPDELLQRPETAYLPADLLQQYRRALSRTSPRVAERALAVRKRIIAALHDAGAGLLLGSDSPQIFNVPGFSIHRELDAMVRAGLSPAEALATGTVAPARYLGRPDDFGRLEVGQAADLIFLSRDPTADIGNSRSIQGVMVRGRWLDRAALDAGLAEIRARYAR